MPERRTTLLDVAQRAGVSGATASFVLTGRDQEMRVSEEARRRVLRAARELSYRPNLLARGLRTNVTHTIALLSDTVATDQYAGQMIYGSLAAALEHQHLLFVAETEGDHAVEAQLIEDLLGRRVDGFIYAAMFTRRAALPRTLRGQPVVMLNCLSEDDGIPAVVPDEFEAGCAAARALLEAGHRHGIHVVGEPAPHTVAGHDRLAGIEVALRAAGVRLAGVIECFWWPEPAYEAVAGFLAGGTRPSALICLNDRVAFGAYQALNAAGIAMPEEVSVVSFDDSDLASWLRPPLTSIALPHLEMGRRAVETLLAKRPPVGVQRLPMPLRRRASIAPPAGDAQEKRRARGG